MVSCMTCKVSCVVCYQNEWSNSVTQESVLCSDRQTMCLEKKTDNERQTDRQWKRDRQTMKERQRQWTTDREWDEVEIWERQHKMLALACDCRQCDVCMCLSERVCVCVWRSLEDIIVWVFTFVSCKVVCMSGCFLCAYVCVCVWVCVCFCVHVCVCVWVKETLLALVSAGHRSGMTWEKRQTMASLLTMRLSSGRRHGDEVRMRGWCLWCERLQNTQRRPRSGMRKAADWKRAQSNKCVFLCRTVTHTHTHTNTHVYNHIRHLYS